MRAELVVIERRRTRPPESRIIALQLIDQRHDRGPRGINRRGMTGRLPAQGRRLAIGPLQVDFLQEGIHEGPVFLVGQHQRQRLLRRELLLRHSTGWRVLRFAAVVQRESERGCKTVLQRIEPILRVTFDDKLRRRDRDPRDELDVPLVIFLLHHPTANLVGGSAAGRNFRQPLKLTQTAGNP